MEYYYIPLIICLSLALSLCWNIGYGQTIIDEPIPIDEPVEIAKPIPLNESVAIARENTENILDVVTLPDIKLFGTEYAVGEPMTVWLQLLNSSKMPIINSTCFAKIWYPNMTLLANNSAMSYLDEGIHYYKVNAPLQFGVYPVSAKCYIPNLVANYSTSYNITAFDNFETGNGIGGTGSWASVWGFADNNYCTIVGTNSPIGSYHMQCRPMATAFAQRMAMLPVGVHVANVSFWAKFNSIEAGEYFYFQIYNGTGWSTVRSWTDGQDEDDIYRRYEFAINSSCLSYGYVFFRFTGEFGDVSDRINIDNVTVWSPQLLGYYTINGTEYQQIMSSGEIHVSEPLSNLNTNMSFAIQEILDYIVAYGTAELKSNHNICLDNMTLLKTLTYENCIGSRCFPYQRNETIDCPRGCYQEFSGEAYCIPTESNIYLWIVLGIVGVIFVLAIAYGLRKGF